MIYTVTLNPALDYVIQVDHFKTGTINRTKTERIYYGGKGINVSTILKELGVESCAYGFIAGFTGAKLKEGLKELKISTDLVEVSEGLTCFNVKMKSDEETAINGLGPIINDHDFHRMKLKVSDLSKKDILILSGEIPACMNEDTYAELLECLSDEVMVIVDALKAPLLKTLKYHPFLIKPNHADLSNLFGKEIRTEEDVIACVKKLQDLGARNVLISREDKGAIFIDEKGEVYRQTTIQDKVVSLVGCGDAMLAGFLAGYLKTNDYQQALKLGVACGSATAYQFGLAKKADILKLEEQL